MDEFKPTGVEFPPIKEFDKSTEWLNELSTSDLFAEINEYVSPIEQAEQFEPSAEFNDEREYGLKECVESAKEIFTPEVLSEWKDMTLEERYEIVERYGEAVATSLGIKAGDLYFEAMDEYTGGYNNGDGNIHINSRMLGDPKNVIRLVDVIAHETRHQFQHEVVANPGRFRISQKVANEWAFGLENYTTSDSTEYDPWGYCYNPVEMDARYFGEAIVREMTKDMINDLGVDYTKERTFHSEETSQPQFFINDRDWHIKAANEALGRGDMSGYKDHIDSARRSTK